MNVILIGPIGAGKTTVAPLLAHKLGLQWCSMDDARFGYYREIGYDEELARKRAAEGFWNLYSYWKPFEAHAVERIVAEHPDAVIDLGAGHSVYEDPVLLERVQRVLDPCPNVVLMLPSPDVDESIRVLNERVEALRDMQPNINEHFLRDASNYHLAKFTVYTQGKTPEETCDEIAALTA